MNNTGKKNCKLKMNNLSKSISLLLGFLFFTSFLQVQSQKQPQDWANLKRYQRENDTLMSRSLK